MTPTFHFPVLLVLSLWFAGSSVVRLVVRRRKSLAGELTEALIDPVRLTCQVTGSFSLALAIWMGAGFFLRDATLLGAHLLAASLVIAGAADAAADWHWPTEISQRFWIPTVQALGLFGVGVAILSYALWLHSVPGPNSAALRADWPFRGPWRVETGGRSPRINYHNGGHPAQAYAVDFVVVGPPNASEGEPIFAPVDGVVVQAVGHRWQGDDPADGNIISIETAGGAVVHLAHLQRGSLRVAEGDRVTAGQEIAACGNTGSAAISHLHVHAERLGQPVPILFGAERRFPLRSDVIDAGR